MQVPIYVFVLYIYVGFLYFEFISCYCELGLNYTLFCFILFYFVCVLFHFLVCTAHIYVLALNGQLTLITGSLVPAPPIGQLFGLAMYQSNSLIAADFTNRCIHTIIPQGFCYTIIVTVIAFLSCCNSLFVILAHV